MISFIIAILVFGVWTLYRLSFNQNLWIDELFLKPLIWLTPILIVSKFNLIQLGFIKKNFYKNILLGLGFGLLLSIERIYVKNLTLNFSIVYVITAFSTAFTEELFFRGYLLNHWLKIIKNPIYAMLLNGVFFTATHVPIAIFIFHYYGYDLFTYLLLNFISGFVDILLFYKTKSIYTSISNHFVWNLFSGIFK